MVSAKAPETRPSAVPDSGEEDQHPEGEEHSGEQEQQEQKEEEEDLLPALCTEEEQTKAEEPG